MYFYICFENFIKIERGGLSNINMKVNEVLIKIVSLVFLFLSRVFVSFSFLSRVRVNLLTLQV